MYISSYTNKIRSRKLCLVSQHSDHANLTEIRTLLGGFVEQTQAYYRLNMDQVFHSIQTRKKYICIGPLGKLKIYGVSLPLRRPRTIPNNETAQTGTCTPLLISLWLMGGFAEFLCHSLFVFGVPGKIGMSTTSCGNAK